MKINDVLFNNPDLNDVTGGMTPQEIGGAIKASSGKIPLVVFIGDSITAREYRIISGCTVVGNGNGTSTVTLGQAYNLLANGSVRFFVGDRTNVEGNGLRSIVSRISGTSAVITSSAPDFSGTVVGVSVIVKAQKTDHGYATFCNARLKSGGFVFNSENFGVGGDTTSDIINRISEITDYIAAHDGPVLAVELSGTNDASGLIASSVILENRATIWGLLKQTGARVIAGTLPPAAVTEENAIVSAVNSGISELADSSGVEVWNFNSVLVDENGDFDAIRMYSDGTHPDISGAARGGYLLSEILSKSLVGYGYNDDSKNTIANSGFVDSGTGLASDWAVTENTTTTTASVVDGGSIGNVQKLSISCADAGGGDSLLQSSSFSSSLSTSKTYKFRANVSVKNAVNVSSVVIGVEITISGVKYLERMLTANVGDSSAMDGQLSGVFETSPIILPSSPAVAVAKCQVYFNGIGSADVFVSDFYSLEV